MNQISAYLNFDGQCREAMQFYKECFGGELSIQTVAESPMAGPMPPEAAGHVLHSMLVIEGLLLMASDMMGRQMTRGNAVTLSAHAGTQEEGEAIFSKLSAGGTVREPFQMMFWGAMFGLLTDRYGFAWMVNFDPNAQH